MSLSILKEKTGDKAYKEHRHAIVFLSRTLGKLGYSSPSSLISIGDTEYRTIFINQGSHTAVFITTSIIDGESSVYVCNSKEVQKQKDRPVEVLKKEDGIRMLKLKSVYINNETVTREQSLLKALEILNVTSGSEKREKKLVEDCIEINEDGERFINFARIKKNIYIEGITLDYRKLNKIKSKT